MLIASRNGAKLVDTTVGNYFVPYQLFYDDKLIEFDESGMYQLIAEKEYTDIHAEKEMYGKMVELTISYDGKSALPKEIYHDTVTIQIEASTSSGKFAGMSHELHIRGFIDSQFL